MQHIRNWHFDVYYDFWGLFVCIPCKYPVNLLLWIKFKQKLVPNFQLLPPEICRLKTHWLDFIGGWRGAKHNRKKNPKPKPTKEERPSLTPPHSKGKSNTILQLWAYKLDKKRQVRQPYNLISDMHLAWIYTHVSDMKYHSSFRLTPQAAFTYTNLDSSMWEFHHIILLLEMLQHT